MSYASQFLSGSASLWVSGATYAVNDVVRCTTSYQLYVRIVAGAGATAPSADATNWRANSQTAIKSIQRGVISIPGASPSATATITSVDVARSELRFMGSSSATDHPGAAAAYVVLTNSTTVTATRNVSGATVATVSWELTEYH